MPRTCEQLGVCQGRAVPCTGCTASQRTNITTPQALSHKPCSQWQQIGCHVASAIATGCTVAAVYGAASWVYARFFI